MKITPAAIATFFSLVSKDFLLPYSLAPESHQIPIPIPPFGDMSKTDPTNTIPASIIMMMRNACICFYNKKING
ncbi:MAG: hypothetical protein WCG98_02055 [bacterium]